MRRINKAVAVVGAALIVGLLAVGTVMVAGPPSGPPGPPKPPKPEPTPRITPDQIIDGVNQLLPYSKTYRPGDPGFDELVGATPKNRLPNPGIPVSAARSLDGISWLAFPREGVQLFAARSYDDGPFLGQRAGSTRLGAIELARDYKLGSGPLKQGYYHIAAIYDPQNELDAKIDPKNETDFYLVLVADLDNDGEIEIWAFIGLPQKELAHVIGIVDPVLQIEFAQAILLNLIAALLQ